MDHKLFLTRQLQRGYCCVSLWKHSSCNIQQIAFGSFQIKGPILYFETPVSHCPFLHSMPLNSMDELLEEKECNFVCFSSWILKCLKHFYLHMYIHESILKLGSRYDCISHLFFIGKLCIFLHMHNVFDTFVFKVQAC